MEDKIFKKEQIECRDIVMQQKLINILNENSKNYRN